MITAEGFQAAITGLLQMLPMQRQLTGPALVMAWDSFPMTAKQQLSDEMLHWACAQRLKDPEPPKEMAAHLSLLRYLYPLEADRPVVERGLRGDLAERMAEPDRFHNPAPAREDLKPVKRLPQSGFWLPSHMTPEERRDHLEAIAQQLERILAEPVDGNYGQAQLQQGRKWFERALQGFWTLKPDLPPGGGGICRAWCQRNAKWAKDLLEAAMATDAPPPPAADAGIADFLAGAW
jgi:hypothetical protein